jgi:hypothetical protein
VGITNFSATGQALERQFELELGSRQGAPEWSCRRVASFEEYKKVVAELNSDDHVRAIYPVALSLKDADGSVFTTQDIFKWTTANSKKPEMALNYYFSKIGLFGGAAVNFYSMGAVAGEHVSGILSGKPVSSLSVEEAEKCSIVFNLVRARALGIKLSEEMMKSADYLYRD